MTRDNFDEEEKMREEAQRKNSAEPIPHRGENSDMEDAESRHTDKVEQSFQSQPGESDDNTDDSRADTDQGSRHGMGNKR